MFPLDYHLPDFKDGVVHGRVALWLVQRRLVFGTLLNLLTGISGWFLRFDGPKFPIGIIYAVFMLSNSFVLNIDDQVGVLFLELALGVRVLSAALYVYVTLREIRATNPALQKT
ncbi:hypothetical protein [Deinococcus ruber]|uniref:Uncharacterized protein n=1 Tax=Deinococcus ruber TaxID=1848197 RepID=A0A918FI33_9DEIO|nr:hypothetical protein [Deinococcus ruber]GGR39037.1 hypothetical protein GCM10008957_54990 [Deinococcus ruber]